MVSTFGMATLVETFSQNLKYFRLEKGLSQEELAELAEKYINQGLRELEREKLKLEKAQGKGGLFSDWKISQIKNSIRDLESNINMWQGYDEYVIPKFKLSLENSNKIGEEIPNHFRQLRIRLLNLISMHAEIND